MKRYFGLCIIIIWSICASPRPVAAQAARAIPQPGRDVFERTCAGCHGTASKDNTPDVKSLMSLGPEAIYTAVTTGIMAVPAANLTDEQQIEAEDDYRICARRGGSEGAESTRKKRANRRAHPKQLEE